MNRRILKVNELIKQQLSRWIQEEFSEKYGIICVNHLEVSADLAFAKAWLSFSSNNPQAVINTLTAAQKEFRAHLGRELKLRTIPKIQFILDETAEKIMGIDQILHKIKKNNE